MDSGKYSQTSTITLQPFIIDLNLTSVLSNSIVDISFRLNFRDPDNVALQRAHKNYSHDWRKIQFNFQLPHSSACSRATHTDVVFGSYPFRIVHPPELMFSPLPRLYQKKVAKKEKREKLSLQQFIIYART